MVQSKAWKWELIDKNDSYWNTPALEIYFLSAYWQKREFKKLLDVGCGFGRNAIYMAKQGFDVSGFDLSDVSVALTKEKAKLEGIKLNKFVVADMLNFPFENDSFDCIFAYNVLLHTDRLGFIKTLKEIKRVLKPYGEVYLTVGSKDSPWFLDPQSVYVDENTRIIQSDYPDSGIPHFYIDDNDCQELFKDFKILSIKSVRDLTFDGTFNTQYHIWLKNMDEE